MAAFIAGSFPFSLWVGRFLLGKDIRHYGDANPGATNVLRAGGKKAYGLALLLDFTKGAIPVGAARFMGGVDNWALVFVALAPILGHAFSPILRFRGGKAVAVTGGVWCALTAWEAPILGSFLLTIFSLILGANGWAVMGTMAGMLLYFSVTPTEWNQLIQAVPSLRANFWPTLIALWLGNTAILAWKYRADLASIDSTIRRPQSWLHKK